MTELNLKEKPLLGLNALVAEDDFLNLYLVKEILDEAGVASVDVVSTLSEAQSCLENHYDFVVLDVRLRDGHSYDFAKRMLSQNIPVTFHSGQVDAEEEVNFPKAAFCGKPTTPTALINAVLLSQEKAAG